MRTVGHAEYYVIFIDNVNRWISIDLMRKKSEVFTNYRNYEAWLKTQFGTSIKTFQSNKGGEYMSTECQSHSTLRLPTCYERLLVLSNPCWTLPVGCSLVHRGRIESTINLYPAKGKAMAMSAATTSLEWPD